MRPRRLARCAVVLGTLLAAPLAAQEGEARFRDVRFDSGETLAEVRLHYRTFGQPRRDAAGTVRNAVLILHGTGGSHAQFLRPDFAGELFGAGQPFDTAAFYVIIPDNLGHGRSSKPSDGLRQAFPRYGYHDMVRLQERLLREHLGVTHLRVILGTSMGCMHAWVWGTTRPAAADLLVPLACQPAQISGRNRMMRRMAMDDILDDPAFAGGNYTTQPPGLRGALQLLFLMGSAPLVQQAQAPTRDAADSVIRAFLDARMRTTDANDFLRQFDASRDYDPWPLLERVTADVLFINSADDLINPPELPAAREGCARVRRCRFVLLPVSPATRGHGSHTVAPLWKAELARALGALPPT